MVLLSLPSGKPFLAQFLGCVGAGGNIAQTQEARPSMACWRDHSAGTSRRRAMPIPLGNRPSIAAFTSVGERKATRILFNFVIRWVFLRTPLNGSKSTAEPIARVQRVQSNLLPHDIAIRMPLQPESCLLFSRFTQGPSQAGCRVQPLFLRYGKTADEDGHLVYGTRGPDADRTLCC